jgi:hypothetical protein
MLGLRAVGTRRKLVAIMVSDHVMTLRLINEHHLLEHLYRSVIVVKYESRSEHVVARALRLCSRLLLLRKGFALAERLHRQSNSYSYGRICFHQE